MPESAVLSDSALTRKVLDSDMTAFQELYSRYAELLYNYIWYRMRSVEESRDMVQEVFVRVWEHRDRLDPGKSIKCYLYRVAHNLVIDKVRKRKSDHTFRSEVSDKITSPEKEMDIRLSVLSAVQTLPEKEKQVIMLSRFQGLSYQEISHVCGISVKAIESRMTKAFRHLREALGENFLQETGKKE